MVGMPGNMPVDKELRELRVREMPQQDMHGPWMLLHAVQGRCCQLCLMACGHAGRGCIGNICQQMGVSARCLS